MTSEYILIIRNVVTNKRKKIASWKYYEIVDILRDLGIGQDESYSAGKWAARAKPGETMSTGIVRLEVKE